MRKHFLTAAVSANFINEPADQDNGGGVIASVDFDTRGCIGGAARR